MSYRATMNVEHCVDYLRSIGIDVPEETAAAWLAKQAETRASRRANRRELKRSCGHFRTYWCRVTSVEGVEDVRCCTDCGNAVERRRASRWGQP